MTKILFMGTPDFSATVLKGLISDERYEILAVVTQPDRAVGRKKEIRMTPVKEAALEAGASLLPKYRGGAPIHYAIMNGDKEAGVTIMEMVREMDAGDMISSRAIPILEEDNVGTLFEKLALVGRDLLLETLPAYLGGELKPQPQDPQQARRRTPGLDTDQP